MHDKLNIDVSLNAIYGLSSSDLSYEYFGRRFNQQPTAIIDLPEPSDTRKVLREFYRDMNVLVIRGVFIKGINGGDQWLHMPFLKGHLADGVAR
jgi:hypothetical protein